LFGKVDIWSLIEILVLLKYKFIESGYINMSILIYTYLVSLVFRQL